MKLYIGGFEMINYIDSNCISFRAYTDKNGVLYIPDEVSDIVEKIKSDFNIGIKDIGGNFNETIFYFDRDLTEDEAEEMYEQFD